MKTNPLTAKPAPNDLLIDVSQLEPACYQTKPDLSNPNQLVSFGTSAHRETSFNEMFTETHIPATTQDICELQLRNISTKILLRA